MEITVGQECFEPQEASFYINHPLPLVRQAAQLIQRWFGNLTDFELTTSGSTGEPKRIIHQKKYLEWLAGQTRVRMNLGKNERVCCCLPLDKAGGFMMLIRSLVHDWSIEILEPVANPSENWKIQPTFISLVPYQVEQILAAKNGTDRLSAIPHVLLGGTAFTGAALDNLKNRVNPAYMGYGMTETAGHVSLKKIESNFEEEPYYPFEGVRFSSENDCISIDIPAFDIHLNTRDLGYVENGNLYLTGRSEELLNSGGLKITTTTLERHLAQYFKHNPKIPDRVVFGIPSEIFGETICVVFEGDLPDDKTLQDCKNYLSGKIDRRLIPRHFFSLEQIPRVNMKPDRKKLSQIFAERLS